MGAHTPISQNEKDSEGAGGAPSKYSRTVSCPEAWGPFSAHVPFRPWAVPCVGLPSVWQLEPKNYLLADLPPVLKTGLPHRVW